MPRPSYHHILISLIAAIGLMQMTLFIGYVIVRSLQKVEQMAQEKQTIETLEAEINGLKELRSRAQNDPIFLMELARCQGFLDHSETAIVDQSKVGKEQLAPCAPKQLLPKIEP
ncbi:MAG: hypothetical protein U0Z75_00040 [Deinococcaceae bacterium]